MLKYYDTDAEVFADYATDILGIPNNRIKILLNNAAKESELLLSVKITELHRYVEQNISFYQTTKK